MHFNVFGHVAQHKGLKPGDSVLKEIGASNPFPGIQLPQGTMVTASIIECENAEAMAAASLEMTLAGATVNRIPVMQVSTGEAEGTVERLKV